MKIKMACQRWQRSKVGKVQVILLDQTILPSIMSTCLWRLSPQTYKIWSRACPQKWYLRLACSIQSQSSMKSMTWVNPKRTKSTWWTCHHYAGVSVISPLTVWLESRYYPARASSSNNEMIASFPSSPYFPTKSKAWMKQQLWRLRLSYWWHLIYRRWVVEWACGLAHASSRWGRTTLNDQIAQI